MTYAVEFTSDPAAFLEAGEGILGADPVVTTVLAAFACGGLGAHGHRRRRVEGSR